MITKEIQASEGMQLLEGPRCFPNRYYMDNLF
jgi:hypothetical protein